MPNTHHEIKLTEADREEGITKKTRNGFKTTEKLTDAAFNNFFNEIFFFGGNPNSIGYESDGYRSEEEDILQASGVEPISKSQKTEARINAQKQTAGVFIEQRNIANEQQTETNSL